MLIESIFPLNTSTLYGCSIQKNFKTTPSIYLSKEKKNLFILFHSNQLSLSFSLYFLIASLGLFVCLSILLQFFSRKNGRIAFSLLSIQLELDCAGDPKVQHHYFNNNKFNPNRPIISQFVWLSISLQSTSACSTRLAPLLIKGQAR